MHTCRYAGRAMSHRLAWSTFLTLLALGCGPTRESTTPDPVIDVTPTATASSDGDATIPDASATAVVTAQPTATATPAVTPATAATATATATATAAAPAILNQDAIEVSSPLGFELGSARLRADSAQAIEEIAELLRQRADITLMRVEVHTDSDGDDRANLKLSDDRAMGIARALASRGVECKRLIAVGFGESKPIAPNDSAQNKARNRRISLFVAALRGRPIGSKPIDGGGHVAGDPCS